MAVSANISSTEVRTALVERYVGHYFEAALINAPGITYSPGDTNDTTFMSFECPQGVSGYNREIFNYSASDVMAYSERGVGLSTKSTIFSHDGAADAINFTHVALCWGGGNIIAMGATTQEPEIGTEGLYTNLPTQTSGSGTGLFLDLTISNNVFVYTISKPGRGYQVNDVVTVLGTDMHQVGAISSELEQSNATLPVDTVSVEPYQGNVLAVVQTSSAVSLIAGTQAAFYWNNKLYGAS
jgi:hypothetical protein